MGRRQIACRCPPSSLPANAIRHERLSACASLGTRGVKSHRSIRDRWQPVKSRIEAYLRPGQGTPSQSFAARLSFFTLWGLGIYEIGNAQHLVRRILLEEFGLWNQLGEP